MISKKLIYILIFLVFGHFNVVSQSLNDSGDLVLFADRNFCLSGDTLWFKVWMPNSFQQKENVVRVQLDDRGNNLISTVIIKAEKDWAQGFINVPDSLSTGQYFVTAFFNSQRNLPDLTIKSKSLLVYNRFEEYVSELDVLDDKYIEESIVGNRGLKIDTDKEIYQTREKVTVKFGADKEFQKAVIKATIVDPLTKKLGKSYQFELESSNSQIPDFEEQDGFLISGKVVDVVGKPQKGALILLSIMGEPSYFDYYLSGNEGDFHFFLKNAVGSTDMVLQAVLSNQKELFIEQELNYLKRKEELVMQTKALTSGQSEFISLLTKGNFIDRLFKSLNVQQIEYFEMPARFSMPFYGQPTQRVFPEEFLELPDFNEISKELLFGVQYRNRKGNVTIRMIGDTNQGFFNSEPLRLLNGIPIFKNSLYSSLKSEDINYIDITRNERIFGDLSFKGILAVSLFDKSNSWMAEQANIFQFNINCLQPKSTPEYLPDNKTNRSLPDVRQVFYWEVLNQDSINEIEFSLSDLKGEVEISFEGIAANNKIFRVSKTIEVK
jgi:hypothetical protein